MELSQLICRAQDVMTVSRAFGTPHDHNGTLIIPVAIVIGGSGGGGGEQQTALPESPAARGGSKGEGGGFGAVTWPIGVYAVTEGNVRWVPAVDPTRIALAALGVIRTLVRLRARRKGR